MLPLDPAGPELDALVAAVADRVRAFLATVRGRPAWDPAVPPAPPIPEEGIPVEAALDAVVAALDPGFHTSRPGYLAFVPGGGLPVAALADWMALTWNRFGGVRAPAPAAVALEEAVLRWLGAEMGLPPAARGVLTSGGSVSNLLAAVAARGRLGEDFADGVVYGSGETHRCVPKALRVAGFPARAWRALPVDNRFRLDLDALRDAVGADRARGLRPLMVVANAGTTNTGAIDPLPEVAELCAAEGLWLHVDGAYGGAFALCEEGRAKLRGLERADSLTLDPHKGLFLPYGTGALLVRDPEALRAAHATDAAYLRDVRGEADFTDLSPELSREVRGLRLWLPLQVHGVRAFREALAEKLVLARRFADGIRDLPGVELLDEPQLSTVAFRLGDDARTERALAAINARRRVFLSSSIIGGRVAIRCCVVSFRTRAEDVETAVGEVRLEA